MIAPGKRLKNWNMRTEITKRDEIYHALRGASTKSAGFAD
jgi:hypothetical protein